MVGVVVTIDKRALVGAVSRLGDLAPVMGADVLDAARFGADSLEDSFDRQVSLDTGAQWVRTKPFGRRLPPRRTLQRSGAYREAWLGLGVGGRVQVTASSVSIGVDPTLFPQVRVFQDVGPTSVPVTPKMRGFVAVEHGVYLRKTTTTITIPERRLALGHGVADRASQAIAIFIADGKVRAA